MIMLWNLKRRRITMNREEYAAYAKAMYLRPCGDNAPGQKFSRGVKVKVADEMPPTMAHFPKGFEAIVEYSCAQKYGGNDIKSYSLIMLADGKPVNSIAWYYEHQLTLLDDDIETGIKIIEQYKNRPETDPKLSDHCV
jgi:hypothetical protein